MDTTQLHIQNWQTFLRGQLRLLPNGGESYEILFDEMAQIIADNMLLAEKPPQNVDNWDDYEFHHCINIDRGTLANPDVVRNCLVSKIKTKVGCYQTDKVFRNLDTGRDYDFTQYYVRVSQELYHLVIRCRTIWNYSHSDCWAVLRGLTNVSKRLQYKYDKFKHASVLKTQDGRQKMHPYDLYLSKKILQNDNTFQTIKNIINWYLQLQGTTHPILQRDLNRKINESKLWDPKAPELTPRQLVADVLVDLYTHVTDNHLGHIESVKYFTYYYFT